MTILLFILGIYFGGVLITKYIIDEDWYISFRWPFLAVLLLLGWLLHIAGFRIH